MIERAEGLPLREQAERVSVGIEREITAARDLQKELFLFNARLAGVGAEQARQSVTRAFHLAQRDKRLRAGLRAMHLELCGGQAGIAEQLQDCARDTAEVTRAVAELDERLSRLQARIGVPLCAPP
mgnify:CR=1 FL=1